MTMQTIAPIRKAAEENGSVKTKLGVIILETLCELMMDHKPDEAERLAKAVIAKPNSAEAVIAMAVGVICHQETCLRAAMRDLDVMQITDPQLAERLLNAIGADDAK